MAYNYDPMQSLANNLSLAGLTAPLDSPTGQGSLDPRFVSAIQTALARAGQQDYGGQTAFNLLSGADQNRAFSDPFGYANELLAKSGVSGFGSAQEWQNANQNLAGHNESLSDISGFADIPGELLSEPGFRALALTAAGGQMLGGPAGAPGAAAGGTAVSGPTGAVGSPLFSTPGGLGTNAFGGTFSTPAMTTFAGPSGSALGGFSAPATLGASGTLAGAGAIGGAANVPAPLTSGGAAGVGAGAGGAATSGGIAGILSSPMTIGALGGAALGGLSGTGTQSGTITVEEGLPDWLMAYAKPQLDKYSTDLQNYQIDPYGVMPSAMQEFQKTISGLYLDPSTNKYLDDYYRLGAERIKGSLSPSFGHMNAFGQHSGYNEALSRGLGDYATMLYGGAYDKERNRQSQLTAAAPSFLGQASTSAFTPYQQYLGTIGSLGKKKEEPFYTNPFAGVLGGALSGATLGGLYGSGAFGSFGK
jgi:hypothetical protein